MRNFLSMGLTERRTDLAGPFEARAQGDGAVSVQDVTKVLAFDVLHGDGRRLAEAVQLVSSADVSVGNLAGQTELIPESLEGGRIAGDFRPEFLATSSPVSWSRAR